MVCLHNNAIVARCILDTNIALWDTRTGSAPSIMSVLLEPHLSTSLLEINILDAILLISNDECMCLCENPKSFFLSF